MTKPKNHSSLKAERLRKLMSYDQVTGVFRRNISAGGQKKGSLAGWTDKDGYLHIRVDGHLYLAHRLAWLHVHGHWPENELDHRNGVSGDNRIKNLRDATHAQNHQNRKRAKNNTSGHTGVSWHRRARKWSAQIEIDDEIIYLGLYTSVDAAAEAYAAAKQKHHRFEPTVRIE